MPTDGKYLGVMKNNQEILQTTTPAMHPRAMCTSAHHMWRNKSLGWLPRTCNTQTVRSQCVDNVEITGEHVQKYWLRMGDKQGERAHGGLQIRSLVPRPGVPW